MSIALTTILLFGGLLVLLAMGVPVAFALGGISVLITLLIVVFIKLVTSL